MRRNGQPVEGGAAVAEPLKKVAAKKPAPKKDAGKPKPGENLVSEKSKNVIRYQLTLVGITPLLTDPMSDDVLTSLRTGIKIEINKDRSLEEICETKLYKDNDGNIAMPSANILAALNTAGKFFKYDAKKNLATNTTSLIPGFLRIVGEFVTFESEEGWKADQRRGRLANGIAVAIVRPKFDNWSIHLEIELDDDEPIKVATVIKLFEKAGKASGLGSFRPSCKGPFGQFELASCVEVELDKSA